MRRAGSERGYKPSRVTRKVSRTSNMRPPASKLRHFNLKDEMKRVCNLHSISDALLRRRMRIVLDRKNKTERVINSGDTQILDVSFLSIQDYRELLEALRWQVTLLQAELDRRSLTCDEVYDWDTPSDAAQSLKRTSHVVEQNQPFDLLNTPFCTCKDCDFDLMDELQSSVICAAEEKCDNSIHCTCFDCVFKLENDPIPSMKACPCRKCQNPLSDV